MGRVIAPNVPTVEIGIRPGEKLHEIMITEDDSSYTLMFDNHYRIISPSLMRNYSGHQQMVPPDFVYRSDTNKDWFTDQSFLQLLVSTGLI